jgi:hypothetical protein
MLVERPDSRRAVHLIQRREGFPVIKTGSGCLIRNCPVHRDRIAIHGVALAGRPLRTLGCGWCKVEKWTKERHEVFFTANSMRGNGRRSLVALRPGLPFGQLLESGVARLSWRGLGELRCHLRRK